MFIAISPSRRSKVFVAVQSLWLLEQGLIDILRIPLPPVLAYFRNLFFEFATRLGDQTMFHVYYPNGSGAIFFVELDVIVGMPGFATACHGEHVSIADHGGDLTGSLLYPCHKGFIMHCRRLLFFNWYVPHNLTLSGRSAHSISRHCPTGTGWSENLPY